MYWSAPINLYCERTDSSFWSEPLNAISNVTFLIVGVAAFLQWRSNGARDLPTLALILVVVVIGVGSFLFHTLATRGVELLDVIPIAIFVFGYVLLALRRLLRATFIPSLAISTAIIALAAVLAWCFPRVLNGSAAFLPALAVLLLIGVLARARPVLSAAGVFALSLSFRSIDFTVCNVIPFGTHFLWHALSALVLYMLLQTIISSRTSLP
jgi:hypothetical protein